MGQAHPRPASPSWAAFFCFSSSDDYASGLAAIFLAQRSASSPTRYFQGARHGGTPNNQQRLSRITPAGTRTNPEPELAPPRRRTSGAAKQTTQAEEEMGDGEPGHKLSPAESREVMLAFLRFLGADARLPASADQPDAYSALVRAILSSVAVSASPTPRVSCTITVSHAVTSEVDVEAQILRKGRSVVVTTIDFRLKDTKRLCYTSRATFYIMPMASL
ncbi:uncharacterized protein LOC8061659 isoform X2 [Sorghum bicolor]|uniref:uncharacterized protein LOC8061659 isoform X2 n=1 Tax=Sorghum bicolor TaxID=4558 RepID=UPI000B4246A9|nr:uncharacterized protein LOC8061659 isoform X2 [Sorghum bicolor]|eukprot:XP_021310171.1 uncharacterized protein LOC8061659 isoform X2 [Sorghum bicolor]